MVVSFPELFEQSYHRAVGGECYNEAFIRRFYELFFASSPGVSFKFQHTNMSVQKTMLHDSLQMLVEFAHKPVATPQLRKLAAIHSAKQHDIAPILYERWLDSLIATVAEFDPEFNDDIALAWRITFSPGICFLTYFYGR